MKKFYYYQKSTKPRIPHALYQDKLLDTITAKDIMDADKIFENRHGKDPSKTHGIVVCLNKDYNVNTYKIRIIQRDRKGLTEDFFDIEVEADTRKQARFIARTLHSLPKYTLAKCKKI